ncbi:hypothetical protein ACE1B6_21435 [Aerosakkonemataceae cyanobacterium BLCC-F154]|uniref:Uncharacterized protein n=1 Tax=Floridaenema fluviatile BLCC-F154 TaxID=3153640 RepID=A0ABV4YG67_9CYAN
MSEQTPEQRQNQYLTLIDELLKCPNGQEPDVLDAHLDLIDENFINTLVQVAAGFAHNNNHDAAKFLIFIARELAKQLGLYPEQPTNTVPSEA